MWFKRDNQEKILLQYLPKGRVYKQAFVKGSNFNKVIKWLAKQFEFLIDKYNEVFKGMYLCESDVLVSNFKKDYLIPNEVFYNADTTEHRKDVFVLRYLMWGNKKWNFQAIANLYGYDIEIYSGKDYFKKSRIPNRIPTRLYGNIQNVNNVIVIIFNNEEINPMPHSIPHKLGSGLGVSKIKRIFDIIKQSQTKILYMKPMYDIKTKDVTDYLPHKIPYKLGSQTSVEIIYHTNQTERINLCIKGESNA